VSRRFEGSYCAGTIDSAQEVFISFLVVKYIFSPAVWIDLLRVVGEASCAVEREIVMSCPANLIIHQGNLQIDVFYHVPVC